LSIAALNSAVVLVLAGLIWSGAGVLSSAWDDVRRVRESTRSWRCWKARPAACRT